MTGVRFSQLWVGLGVVWLVLGQLVVANEPAPAEPSPEPNEELAWVRTWAVLGAVESSDTFTLVYEEVSAKTEEKEGMGEVLFTGLKGCRRSGFGAGYRMFSPGKYRFLLFNDNNRERPVASVELKLEAGVAQTLLATLNGGKPVLRAIHEHPTPPEQEGIYVYHLLENAPLEMQMGWMGRQNVPYAGGEPVFVPVGSAVKPMQVFFQSRRKTEVTRELEYPGRGRWSVVFMRNDYSQPSIFVYPGEPAQE